MGKNNVVMTWITGLILAGLIISFVNLGISYTNPIPEWSDYCDDRTTPVNESKNYDYTSCSQAYDDARAIYNQQIFYVLAGIGFVLLIIGIWSSALLLQLIGLFGGGFLTIESVIRNLDNKLLSLITLGAIIILVGIYAYKKLGDKR